MIRTALVTLTLAIAGTVQAAAVPQGSNYDNRIQLVNYNPLDVVLVHASVGNVSRIVLERGEMILAHPTGFDDGYSITARGHILYIKPMTFNGVRPNAREWSTNLLIETDKRPSGYNFDLRLTGANDPSASYQIQFEYPTEAVAQRTAQREIQAAEQAKAQAKALSAVPKNYQYTMTAGANSNDIKPDMAYDDGTFTYLRFPRDIPAVFAVNQEGQESRVNRNVDANVVRIHQLSGRFALRLGNQVITVQNNGWR